MNNAEQALNRVNSSRTLAVYFDLGGYSENTNILIFKRNVVFIEAK